jgi:hypothetical protein
VLSDTVGAAKLSQLSRALSNEADDKDFLAIVSDVTRLRDQKCKGASNSATMSEPNSLLVSVPENSSSRTWVSADAETYFLQTISCENSKRLDGFLSAVVKLCFTPSKPYDAASPGTSRPLTVRQRPCRGPDGLGPGHPRGTISIAYQAPTGAGALVSQLPPALTFDWGA